jgi:hypothetical protein
MKKQYLSILVLLAIYAESTPAALAERNGISGEVSIATGYTSSKSNFNTDGDSIKSGELNSEGHSDNQVAFIPLGSLQYTFGTGLDKQVYVGTSREDISVGDFALEVGYSQEFIYGTVASVSYIPAIASGETWEDPYLIDTKRKTTDQSGDAYRFKLSTIAGSGLSVDLAFATTDVDNEKSGTDLSLDERKLLDRNGSSLYIKTDYKFELDQTSALVPSITYISHAADGKAMSFTSYTGELTYYKAIGNHLLAATVGYGNSSYDEINPLFNKTRSDDSYSLFVAYEYNAVFGLNNWSLVSFAGYSDSSSNIKFYDEGGYMVLVGMNYRF